MVSTNRNEETGKHHENMWLVRYFQRVVIPNEPGIRSSTRIVGADKAQDT